MGLNKRTVEFKIFLNNNIIVIVWLGHGDQIMLQKTKSMINDHLLISALTNCFLQFRDACRSGHDNFHRDMIM